MINIILKLKNKTVPKGQRKTDEKAPLLSYSWKLLLTKLGVHHSSL
jgi:hypothetical protein